MQVLIPTISTSANCGIKHAGHHGLLQHCQGNSLDDAPGASPTLSGTRASLIYDKYRYSRRRNRVTSGTSRHYPYYNMDQGWRGPHEFDRSRLTDNLRPDPNTPITNETPKENSQRTACAECSLGYAAAYVSLRGKDIVYRIDVDTSKGTHPRGRATSSIADGTLTKRLGRPARPRGFARFRSGSGDSACSPPISTTSLISLCPRHPGRILLSARDQWCSESPTYPATR